MLLPGGQPAVGIGEGSADLGARGFWQREGGLRIDGVKVQQLGVFQVVRVVKFDQGRIIDGPVMLLQHQVIDVHGHVGTGLQAHQCCDRVCCVIDPRRTDVQGLLEDLPATGLEYRADRLTGKDLRVLGIDKRIRLVDKPDHRIGAAGMDAVLVAVQVRPPQARPALYDLDAVAAEAFGDPLAVEPLGFVRAGVDGGGDDRAWKLVAVHNTYCQPFDGAPYTLALAA